MRGNNKKRLNIKVDGNHLFITVGRIRRRFIMKLKKKGRVCHK